MFRGHFVSRRDGPNHDYRHPHARQPPVRRLRIESLEDRAMLSIGAGPDNRDALASPSADVSSDLAAAVDPAAVNDSGDGGQGALSQFAQYQHIILDQPTGTPLVSSQGSIMSGDETVPLSFGGPVGLTPRQIRTAYGITGIAGNGAGQTIAIVDAYDDPNVAADLHAFDQQFGSQLGVLTDPVFTKVNQTGGSTYPSADYGWAAEIALDVEWAHAIAPGANILLVEATSNWMPDMLAAVDYARSAPGVVAVSMSWGTNEYSGEASDNVHFATPADHTGVTFLAATGDNGSPGLYPAYSPNVVAVGGTTLVVNGDNYALEVAWSGGGGQSVYQTKPSYQAGVQTSGWRQIPDVAFDADPGSGVTVYNSFNGGSYPWYQVGGTSLSSPCWAGLVAIGDQLRAPQGLTPMDGRSDALPLLYSMSATDFHDVTYGSNGGFSAGPGYDMVTGRGSPVADVLALDFAPLTLTLPANPTEGNGTVTGAVNIRTALSTDLHVSLASSDTSRLTVPASVTIPAGFTSAPVPFSIIDDNLLNGVEPVVITATATATGYPPISGTITVHDNETATLTVSLPASVIETAGVLAGAGMVYSNRAPTRDIVVQLVSNYASGLTVPTSVTLRDGHTSVAFDVTMHDDHVLQGPRPVAVTAAVENWTPGSATLLDVDNDATITVGLPVDSWEGQGVLPGAGTVRLGGVMATDLAVSLSSGDLSHLVVPASVTIPAGQISQDFDLTIGSNLVPDRTKTVTVTASAATFTNATRTMVVHASGLDHFTWDPITSPENATVPFVATARAVNLDNETILVYTATASLSAAGDHGAVPVTPAQCTFVGGVWTGAVSLTSADTGVTLTLDGGAGHTGRSSSFTVQTHGPLASFQWSDIATPQFKGEPFTVTVKAVDAFGTTESDYNGQPNLSGIASSSVQIGTGTIPSDAPLATAQESARTQVIYLASELGPSRLITALSLDVTTVPGQVMNNWTIRMKHTSLASYSTYAWEGPTSGWTTVYQTNQTITATGWVAFTFTTPFLYDGVDNLMIDFSFRNTSRSSAGGCHYTLTSSTRSLSYRDYYGTYTDPLNWSGTNSPSPQSSSTIPNVILAFAPVSVIPASPNFVNGIWTGSVTVPQTINWVYLNLDDGAGHTGLSNIFYVYDAPSNPGPASGAANVPVSGTNLSWTGTQPAVNVDTVGSASPRIIGSQAGGGSVYNVTASRTLTQIETYLSITTSTDLRFFVYAGYSQNGMYDKVFEQDVPVSGTGTKWYNSGTISLPLTPEYYCIGVSWQASSTGYGDATTRAVSFGSQVDSYSVRYPLPASLFNLSIGGAIYERLTTVAETYDVNLDTASPPTRQVSQGTTQTAVSAGTLANDTTYYWQIVAHNSLGAAAEHRLAIHHPARRAGCSPFQRRLRKSWSPAEHYLHVRQHRRLGQRWGGPLPLPLGPEPNRHAHRL